VVIAALKKKGSANGFRSLRDYLLKNINTFRGIPFASLLTLVIACDKHAMFADMAAVKSNSKRDETRWNLWQQYMQGNVDTMDEGETHGEGDGEALGLDEDGDETGDSEGDE
jgi:hypothetical protein